MYIGTVEVRYTGMYISSSFQGPNQLTRSHFLKANGQTVLTMQDGNHPNELNTLFHTFSDHLGSACTLMEAGGHIISREYHTPFGETAYSSTSRARYRYCGKEKDSESGLYYYGARYYSAWTCRFVSVDPLAEEYAQLSSYNYADNSPVTEIDLDGLQGTGTEKSAGSDSTNTATPTDSSQDSSCNPKLPTPKLSTVDSNGVAGAYVMREVEVVAPLRTFVSNNDNLTPNTSDQNKPGDHLIRYMSMYEKMYGNPFLQSSKLNNRTFVFSQHESYKPLEPVKNGMVRSGPGPRTLSNGDSRPHPGYDIVPTPNTPLTKEGLVPILAPFDGVITLTKSKKGPRMSDPTDYGNLVVLKVNDDLKVYFAHLSDYRFPIVSKKQSIAKGDTLGFMGMTGYTTGLHLHIEGRTGGFGSKRNNQPLEYLIK